MIWDKEAALYFSRSIGFIRKDSSQNADKVKQEILQKINELPDNPVIHPADKYKQENNGNYRYFELHRHRISYLIKEQEIIITRIRHTSQKPQQY